MRCLDAVTFFETFLIVSSYFFPIRLSFFACSPRSFIPSELVARTLRSDKDGSRSGRKHGKTGLFNQKSIGQNLIGVLGTFLILARSTENKKNTSLVGFLRCWLVFGGSMALQAMCLQDPIEEITRLLIRTHTPGDSADTSKGSSRGVK